MLCRRVAGVVRGVAGGNRLDGVAGTWPEHPSGTNRQPDHRGNPITQLITESRKHTAQSPARHRRHRARPLQAADLTGQRF